MSTSRALLQSAKDAGWLALSYYVRLLKIAFTGAWAVVGGISTVLALVVPLLIKAYLRRYPATHPESVEWVNDLIWQAPLVAFGCVFLSRLALAPFIAFRQDLPDRTALGLVFDEANEICWSVRQPYADNGLFLADLRLGVVNPSGREVDGVELVACGSEPPILPPFFGYKFPKYPGEETVQSVPRGTMTTPTAYFSVATCGVNTEGKDERRWLSVEPVVDAIYDRSKGPKQSLKLRLRHPGGVTYWRVTIELRGDAAHASLESSTIEATVQARPGQASAS